MKITEYSDPVPHLIIDNLLPQEEIDKMIKEAVNLDSNFKQGKYIKINETKESIDLKVKNVKDFWIDQYYKDDRNGSPILNMVDNVLFGQELKKIYDDRKCPFFNIINKTTNDATHLIRYGNQDFYDFHIDTYKDPYGWWTMNFWFCKEPIKFTGGDFELKFKDEKKIIKYRNNRLIIFPVNTFHKVLPLKLDSDNLEDFRYAVQSWSW